MHAPVRIQAPQSMPVSLEEAKRHLRIEPEATLEDGLISGLIAAATGHLDGWTGILGRCLVEQEWRQDFDGFSQCLPLPLGPVMSITSVTWRNAAGQISTVASTAHSLRTDAGGRSHCRFRDDFSFPVDLYQVAAVSVSYRAGWELADVPAEIKQAILLLVGAWYENREETAIGVSVASLPNSVAVNALIAPYRRIGI